MPHAVIAGDLSPELVHRSLEPFQERDGDFVARIGESHLARDGSRALIEAVVVERNVRRVFLVEVLRRDDGVTVRLFQLTDPEKTEGVRRLLAAVAARIQSLVPHARIQHTNLTPHLDVT